MRGKASRLRPEDVLRHSAETTTLISRLTFMSLLNVLTDPDVRFSASGSSRESFARGGIVMDDPGCWQRVTL
jgi:hypothetical protein